jgi:hypothetical protein
MCFSKTIVAYFLPLIFICFFALICLGLCFHKPNIAHYVKFIHVDSLQKVDVYIDNVHFTSYQYASQLKKPVLFPIYASGNRLITRGFPLDTRPNERIDHPHHYGLWFNHGDVNGLDFWNNSDSIAPEKRANYGTIYHRKFLKIKEGKKGILEVEKDWVTPTGEVVLKEKTQYVFSGDDNVWQIEHFSTLTAQNKNVHFEDSKEGMFALRLCSALEHPADKPTILTGENLLPDTTQKRNLLATGHYLNSEGIEGEDVWGRRAKWVKLSGKVQQNRINIVIMDHPQNINHPAHWMARGYGLFGVNSLGSKVYSEGKEELNYQLSARKSIQFHHLVLITENEDLNKTTIEKYYHHFIK